MFRIRQPESKICIVKYHPKTMEIHPYRLTTYLFCTVVGVLPQTSKLKIKTTKYDSAPIPSNSWVTLQFIYVRIILFRVETF